MNTLEIKNWCDQKLIIGKLYKITSLSKDCGVTLDKTWFSSMVTKDHEIIVLILGEPELIPEIPQDRKGLTAVADYLYQKVLFENKIFYFSLSRNAKDFFKIEEIG